MSYLDGQLAGSFKGVPFFTRSEVRENVGQTRVKHTYPKTGVQYLEPMGKDVPIGTGIFIGQGDDWSGNGFSRIWLIYLAPAADIVTNALSSQLL